MNGPLLMNRFRQIETLQLVRMAFGRYIEVECIHERVAGRLSRYPEKAAFGVLC